MLSDVTLGEVGDCQGLPPFLAGGWIFASADSSDDFKDLFARLRQSELAVCAERREPAARQAPVVDDERLTAGRLEATPNPGISVSQM